MDASGRLSWAATLAIVAGVTALDAAGKTLKLNFPRYLGDASYSIYLWHGIALTIVTKLSHALHLPVALTVAAGIVGGTAGGIAAYELIERPIARLLKGHPKQAPATA